MISVDKSCLVAILLKQGGTIAAAIDGAKTTVSRR